MSKLRIDMSTAGLGLGGFQIKGADRNTYTKDFIREGTWSVNDGGKLKKFQVTQERIKKWAETFKLMRSRGITIPLTVDHMEIRDPTTGKLKLKQFTPGMAEAKRGDVVDLFGEGDLGICRVVPADTQARVLLNRCPEVSLELTPEFTDGRGNFYEEAITAITLTSKPVYQGQQLEWVLSEVKMSGDSPEVIRLSAEPFVEELDPSRGKNMTPTLMARLRNALKMSSEPEDEVHSKAVDHMEQCSRGMYMSRADHDIAVAAAVKAKDDRIIVLSRDLETEKSAASGKKVHMSLVEMTAEVDEDALDMAAEAFTTRINALGAKCTPVQKKLLSGLLVGEPGKRNVIALSRKTAIKIGLEAPLADSVLKVFEAADISEMTKLLAEQSKGQKILLARETPKADGTTDDFDPALAKRMADNVNGTANGTFVL